MSDNVFYIAHEHKIAISKDENLKKLFCYDVDKKGEVSMETKGQLNHLDLSLAKKVNKHFNINCVDYGVEPVSEKISINLLC